MPASTVSVRSAARARPPGRHAGRAPGAAVAGGPGRPTRDRVPPPTTSTASPSALAARSAAAHSPGEAGRATLTARCRGQRAGVEHQLAAAAAQRQDLGGVHPPLRVERLAGAAWASRSTWLNVRGMKSRFSSPMPCSPESTPPTATHASMIPCRPRGRAPPARVAAVERDQRVQVAVARVEHVHDHEVVLVADLVDPLAASRPGASAAPRSRAGSSSGATRDRAERALARLPEQGALGLVARHAHPARPVLGADPLHDRGCRGHLGLRAVHLHQQHAAASTGRSAWTTPRRPRHPLVHHLHRGRHDALRDDRPRPPGAAAPRREVEQHRAAPAGGCASAAPSPR